MESLINKSGHKRIFIGIRIPQNICEYYYDLVVNLSKSNKYVKPIIPKNIHLTLKFIGTIEIKKLEKMKMVLEKELKNVKCFEYNIKDRLDGFPRFKNARILYGVIGNGSNDIENIYKRIENSISFLGLKTEKKKFVPHITIARLKNDVDLSLIGIEKSVLKDFKKIKCDKITIYESILSPSGADYVVEKEIYLMDTKEL